MVHLYNKVLKKEQCIKYLNFGFDRNYFLLSMSEKCVQLNQSGTCVVIQYGTFTILTDTKLTDVRSIERKCSHYKYLSTAPKMSYK